MEFEDQSQEEQTSKTQRKKEMQALQEIGARLTKFSKAQLGKLPLPDKLRNAIHEYQRLPNSHGAKRRQLQYIGRLMRDFELDEIKKEIDKVIRPPQEAASDNRILETCCEQVLFGGDEAINTLVQEHQFLERQILRKFHLDFSKSKKENNEIACDATRARLKAYLKAELQ